MSAPLSPFDDALAALYAGEIARLRALIAEEPLLLHLRAEATPPLGYFSGATLLHHVSRPTKRRGILTQDLSFLTRGEAA